MTTDSRKSPAETTFLGLAPFLRKSIADNELRPIAQALLASAGSDPDNANLWMNLSIAMLALGERDVGLSIQGAALEMQRIYHLPAAQQPAKFRLLMLMAPGDLAANTPLECLLENSDIDICMYYLTPGNPLALPIPEHDAVLVALSEDDAHRAHLAALETALATWPKPIINAPQNIPNTGRSAASILLQGIPGLVIPPTLSVSRLELFGIATGRKQLDEFLAVCRFPVILRPVGSHAGRDLAKIDSPEEIIHYLGNVIADDFFLSPFINYAGPDGLFRKYRVALVNGQPFACHMGISAHWMIHYVNAGMYEEANKRHEEAKFMEHFGDFTQHHAVALEAIHQRTGLDYVCIDCAETIDGQLLIFEIDHAMVVHAMDPEAMFPYKQQHMEKLKQAFRSFLFGLNA